MVEYWKSKLDKDEVDMYNRICQGILAKKQNVTLSGCSDLQNIVSVFKKVLHDHPEFYNASPQVSAAASMFGIQLDLTYLYSQQQCSSMDRAYQALVQKYRSLAGAQEIEIEKVILSELVLNTQYEINSLYNQNAMSAIYHHKAQCSGFALAFQWLMSHFGIWCISVSGQVRDPKTGTYFPHAWNIIRLSNQYYHVDPTMMLGANTQKTTPLSYHMVNCSDNTMKAAGYQWNFSSTPPCQQDMDMSSVHHSDCPTFSRLYDLHTYVSNHLKQGDVTFSFILNISQYNTDKLMHMITAIVQEKIQELNLNKSFRLTLMDNHYTIRLLQTAL